MVWWDSGDQTPSVGGAGGGPAVVMDAVGVSNAFADRDASWVKVSWEQVVAADPDVIVTVDAAWDPADKKRAYLEADPVRIEQWLIGHACELASKGIGPAALRADARRHGPRLARAGTAVFERGLRQLPA